MARMLATMFLLVAAFSAQAGDDFSSPKATAKTLLTLLRDGRIDRVPECFVRPQTEDERNLLLFGLGVDAYSAALHHALTAKFGENASPLAKTLASFDQQLAVIDSMEETNDGVNARLSIKGLEQGGLAFVGTGNKWKIALVPGIMLRAVPRERLATAHATRSAYLDTIAETDRGEFASADEALAALEARRRLAGRTDPQLKR